MSESMVIAPRIRGFLCLNAHPAGCAANVRSQVEKARAAGPGSGIGRVLVLGASTGYGLATLITAIWGYGADAVAVGFERPPEPGRPGSAGWYNVASTVALAREAGRQLVAINGDAFSDEVLDQVLATEGQFDLVIYSLAAPRRVTAEGTFNSVLKPIGEPFRGRSIHLDKDRLQDVEIQPATEDDIAATTRVMGGEDWSRWISALLGQNRLASGCRTVAYSYVGPEITWPLYRGGTIGKAKEHLEKSAARLNRMLRDYVGGSAVVSINKALVTQASSAIPVVPLYISLLERTLREHGDHERAIEQIVRLFADHLAPGKTPSTDAEGRIRLDDREMRPDVQAEVMRRWPGITTENLATDTDYPAFKREFRQLFGFEVDGVDYDAPVSIDADWR